MDRTLKRTGQKIKTQKYPDTVYVLMKHCLIENCQKWRESRLLNPACFVATINKSDKITGITNIFIDYALGWFWNLD